ncbi:MAG: hypothetical protein ABEJ91_01410 [Candidatus Nanohaloarchaea archaeon]
MVTEKDSAGNPREFRTGIMHASPGDMEHQLEAVYGAVDDYDREDLLEVENTFL